MIGVGVLGRRLGFTYKIPAIKPIFVNAFFVVHCTKFLALQNLDPVSHPHIFDCLTPVCCHGCIHLPPKKTFRFCRGRRFGPTEAMANHGKQLRIGKKQKNVQKKFKHIRTKEC